MDALKSDDFKSKNNAISEQMIMTATIAIKNPFHFIPSVSLFVSLYSRH